MKPQGINLTLEELFDFVCAHSDADDVPLYIAALRINNPEHPWPGDLSKPQWTRADVIDEIARAVRRND